MDEYMKTLQQIMATINGVKAEGAENWRRLLACTQAIESMIEQMKEERGAE